VTHLLFSGGAYKLEDLAHILEWQNVVSVSVVGLGEQILSSEMLNKKGEQTGKPGLGQLRV
jgi:hypothetical protein